jgi:hypothetical protein
MFKKGDKARLVKGWKTDGPAWAKGAEVVVIANGLQQGAFVDVRAADGTEGYCYTNELELIEQD